MTLQKRNKRIGVSAKLTEWVALLSMAFALSIVATVHAETRYWNSPSGLATDVACWLNGVPQSGDAIAVTNGGTMVVAGDFAPTKAQITYGNVIVASGTFAPPSIELGDNSAKGAAIFVCSNGVLQVDAISRGIGAVRVVLAGGELKSGSSAKIEELLQGILLSIAPGCVGTINTAAKDVELDCRLAASTLETSHLLHRWSFNNGSMSDSVGGLTAECHGTGIVTSEKGVCLPGGTRQQTFVSLGSVFPANLTAFTLELWAKQVATQNWSPIFNAFNEDGMKFFMNWTRGAAIDSDKVSTYAASESQQKDLLQPWTLGTLFHISVTARRGLTRWSLEFRKKDALTGVTLKACTMDAPTGWDPAELTSFNLGYAIAADANDAQADYEEVRVWGTELSDADLTLSALNGPDAGMTAGRLVKTGTGSLYLPGKVEAVSSVEISQGAVALDGVARPMHRWSFANGNLSDSCGSTSASLKGTNKSSITSDASGVSLPGGSRLSAYVDLGTGATVFGSEDHDFTFELWATRLDSAETSLAWPRIFSIFETSGSTPTVLSMGWSFSTTVERDVICTYYKGESYVQNNYADKMAPWSQNVEYHIAVTVSPANDGWKATFYKHDAISGETLKEFTTAMPAGWSPRVLANGAVVLGASPDSGQSDARARYSEVRVWDRALSREELAQSARMGKALLPLPKNRAPLAVASTNLTHRWSFNGNWTDSVGGRTAVAAGLDSGKITFEDGAYATLPGSATSRHAYIELSTDGDSLFAEDTDGVTLEFWTRLNATAGRSWQRLFTVYDATSPINALYDTFVKGTDTISDTLGSVIGGTTYQVAGKMAPWVVGQWFHVAIVVRNDGSANPVTLYKQDPVTGWTLARYELPGQNWTPTMMNKSLVGLGYDHESGQSDAAASYSEARVWNRPLTEKELSMCAQAGPDAIPDFNGGILPGTADLLIATNSVLALCGRTQTVHAVMANGAVKGGGCLTVTSGVLIGGAGPAGTFVVEDGARLSGMVSFDVANGVVVDRLLFGVGSTYDVSSIGLAFSQPYPVGWACFGSAVGSELSGSFDFGTESEASWKRNAEGDLLVKLQKTGLMLIVR